MSHITISSLNADIEASAFGLLRGYNIGELTMNNMFKVLKFSRKNFSQLEQKRLLLVILRSYKAFNLHSEYLFNHFLELIGAKTPLSFCLFLQKRSEKMATETFVYYSLLCFNEFKLAKSIFAIIEKLPLRPRQFKITESEERDDSEMTALLYLIKDFTISPDTPFLYEGEDEEEEDVDAANYRMYVESWKEEEDVEVKLLKFLKRK